MRRAGALVLGGVLLLAGIAMLVLPGPGLLVVLAALLVLAREFPSVERHVEPVRERAMSAADDSVATWPRLVASTFFACLLIAAGIVWIYDPGVPLGGVGVGSSLIVSGLAALGLLVYSYRRRHTGRR